MEICVYLLVACLGLDAYTRERWTLAVTWWSLGVWLRPDGLFLALLGLFARPGISSRKLIAPGLVAVGFIGGFFLFNQIVGGHVFPNSVGIKTTPQANPLPPMFYMVRHWAGLWGLPFGPNKVGEHCVMLLPVLIVGAIGAFRRAPAVPIYAVATPIVQALVGVPLGAHGRYIMYVIPFGLVMAVLGFEFITKRVSARAATSWFVAFAVVCVLWQLYTDRKKAIIHGWNVQNINEMQIFMAERIRMGMAPGDTIAVNDVGAMGYFSGCYVVDLVGLVSPKRELPENLRLYKPKMIAVFPDWFAKYVRFDPKTGFPNFYASDSSYKYAPVVRIALKENTISARNTMVLFERLRPGEEAAPSAPVYVR
jgi:hypothetical protein